MLRFLPRIGLAVLTTGLLATGCDSTRSVAPHAGPAGAGTGAGDAGPIDSGSGADAGVGQAARGLRLFVLLYRGDEAAFLDQKLSGDDHVASYAGKANLVTLVENPSRLVSCPSIPEIEKVFSGLPERALDTIAYNPESYVTHGTPQSELDDLSGAVGAARSLADSNSARLAFIPDGPLLESHGTAIAPLVDLFGIQVQRFQLEPDSEFRAAVEKGVGIVREGSPAVPIVIQLFMAPPIYGDDGKPVRDENGNKTYQPVSAEAVIASMELAADLVDGVAIDYNEQTVDEMKRLVELLR